MTDQPLYIAKPHQIGDVVRLNPEAGWRTSELGIRLVITKIPKSAREVNYVAVPCDENGVALPGATPFRGKPYAFMPFGSEDAVDFTVPVPNPPVGSIVRPGEACPAPAGFYAVTGEIDDQRVRMTVIGGDNRRYWKVRSSTLTVLDPKQVAEALSHL